MDEQVFETRAQVSLSQVRSLVEQWIPADYQEAVAKGIWCSPPLRPLPASSRAHGTMHT
jgi:hypothetical protein